MYELLLITFGSIIGMLAGIGIILWLAKVAVEDIIGKKLW